MEFAAHVHLRVVLESLDSVNRSVSTIVEGEIGVPFVARGRPVVDDRPLRHRVIVSAGGDGSMIPAPKKPRPCGSRSRGAALPLSLPERGPTLSVEPPPQRDGSHDRVQIIVHAFPERARSANRPPSCPQQPATSGRGRGGAHRRASSGLLPTLVRRVFAGWLPSA